MLMLCGIVVVVAVAVLCCTLLAGQAATQFCCHNDAQINVIFVWKSRRMPSGQLAVDSFWAPAIATVLDLLLLLLLIAHSPFGQCCMLHVVWVLAILSCRGCNFSSRHCLCVCAWGRGGGERRVSRFQHKWVKRNEKPNIPTQYHMKYLRYIQNS